ncbi:MAG: hypothetical protein KJ767_01605 [Nanoarchaeota archaeon]|nr:hypothetical protein [Nanoarchaeota archaeon]
MVIRRTTKRRTTTKKRTTKRRGKAFGGYTINFRGEGATLEQVFGKAPIAPSMMTKKIWAHVKRRRLSRK